MIRTELIRKVGGYREDLGAQDGLDIWTKLRKEYSYSNVNLPLFYYRRHGNNLTNNQQRIFYSRLEIKRDSVIEELKSYAPVIAVIPCRQMYDFAPNVWQQKIGEKSLLEIQLDLLQSINLFDHIIVTADSDQVLEVVEKYDNPKIKFFKRDVSLTYRSVPFYKTMKLILEKYDPEYRGISVVSYLETPFKSKQLVEESIFTLLMTHSDSAVAAEEIAYPVYQRQNSGLNLLNEKGIISSDFGKLYRELLTVNTFKNSVAKSGSLMGGRIANFSVPRSEGFCLDSKLSLEIANVIKGKVF